MVHKEDYVKIIEKTAELSQEELKMLSSSYDSVYFHQKTYDCALLAVGSLLQVRFSGGGAFKMLINKTNNLFSGCR